MKYKNNLIMKHSNFLFIIVAFISLIAFNACKKEVEVDNETQSVVDNAICEQQFMSIAPNVNTRGTDPGKSPAFKISACGTWSINSTNPSADTATTINGEYTNGPVKFTLDYGPSSSCEGGVEKSGMITIVSTHKWSVITQTNTAVATATITFNNYKASGVSYNCDKIIITKSGASQLTTKVIGGNCQKDGWNIDYACDKTITKNANGDYEITGNSSGKNREGRNFTSNVLGTNPLFKPANYKFITKGKLELTPEGFKTRTVDFGDGTQDDKATFSVGDQTFTFTMK